MTDKSDMRPVAWFIQYEHRHEFLWREPALYERNSALEIKPLYTEPPKREWVGLTDDDFKKFKSDEFVVFAKDIEAILKERNT